MREHIEKKLDKLGKFRGVIEAKIVLKIEKYLYIAEITLLGKNLRFYGEGRSEDHFFAAFDAAEKRVAVQLKKRKERIKNHKIPARRDITEIAPGDEESSAEAVRGERRQEGKGRIIVEKVSPSKPISVEEAQIELILTGKPFHVFRNSRTDAVNVIYKRQDGNFGLIESES